MAILVDGFGRGVYSMLRRFVQDQFCIFVTILYEVLKYQVVIKENIQKYTR